MIEREQQGSKKIEGSDDQGDDKVAEGEHHRDETTESILKNAL